MKNLIYFISGITMANYFRIISKRKTVILLAAAALVTASAVSAQETITFPARSSNLATDSYWTVSEFSEGCCKLDLNVMRWNGSKWAGNKSGGKNSDDYTWNVPLYAPANGVIAACWRNFPDNAKPGNKDKYNEGNMFICGNYITIITDDGYSIGLCHMKQGSMPASLCPSNSDNTTYPSTLAKQDGWHNATYIKPANRPRVREGQYLGRAGNSGNSGGPHLHISTQQIVPRRATASPRRATASPGREKRAASSPLPIRHAWAHRYKESEQHKPGGWFRQRGQGFSRDGSKPGKKMLHTSPYLPRASRGGGGIKYVDTLFLSSNRAVTAVVLRDDRLRLTTWDLVGIGPNSISRNKGHITVGRIKEVHLSEPARDYVLAAVRKPDDTLAMILFKVGITGDVVRVADKVAGKIAELDMAMTRGPNRKVVTAVRLRSGRLKVIAWDVKFTPSGKASVVRLGEADAGVVSAVSISRSKNFNGVFTAVRTGGKLRVIPWKLSNNGKVFTRRAHVSASAIDAYVDVAPLAQGVAVAVRKPEGHLSVITWSVAPSGDIGPLRVSLRAHGTWQLKLLTSPHGGSNLTTVMRAENGNLYLIGWAVDSDGRNLRRLGSSKAGAISALSADVVSRSYTPLDPRDMILTAVRLSNGNLNLYTWDTNLVNP